MGKVDGVGIAFCGGGFRSYAEVAVVEDLERASPSAQLRALLWARLSPPL